MRAQRGVQPPADGGVGLTESEARNKLGSVKVYTSDFRPMKNVLAGRNERSLYKLVCDAADKIVGVHLLGPDAPEILQGAAIAVKAGLDQGGFRRHGGDPPDDGRRTGADALVARSSPGPRSGHGEGTATP